MTARPTLAAALTLAALLGGCATVDAADGDARASIGSGIIARADGASVGSVSLMPGSGGNRLTVSVSSMQPGTYGIHLHQTGRCDAPGFTTAGAHWNPTMRQHGRLNPQGTHHGDLPNLVIGADGSGRLDAPFVGELTGRTGLFDTDGAALIIHARPDDERTDPSGNSGDRIACAVLTPA